MSWKGKFFGALIGLLVTRSVWGAVAGAIIGHMFDQSVGFAPHARAANSMSISDEFFRTTFELMGHVAKSDGRVTEAEIDAARRLMHELRLGANETAIAIACFRAGISTAFDAELGVERRAGNRRQYHRSRSDQSLSTSNEPSSS
jgi:DnaJ like chaperone protein